MEHGSIPERSALLPNQLNETKTNLKAVMEEVAVLKDSWKQLENYLMNVRVYFSLYAPCPWIWTQTWARLRSLQKWLNDGLRPLHRVVEALTWIISNGTLRGRNPC